MKLLYERQGGTPPSDDERLEIEDDGRFRMWRTVGSARVGRFAGRIPASDGAALALDAGAAAAAGGRDITPPRDAALETITVGDVISTMGHHELPPPPWGPLVKRLRDLLDGLTDQPEAAVALEVNPDATVVRLRHLGQQALALDVVDPSIDITIFEPNGAQGDRWSGPDATWVRPGRLALSGGRTLDIPVSHGLPLEAGRRAQVWVEVDAFDEDDFRRRLRLVTATEPAP